MDPTSTRAETCMLPGQGICGYTAYPGVNFGCCQDPYECTVVNLDFSVCTGANLPMGSTCWSSPDPTNQSDVNSIYCRYNFLKINLQQFKSK